jgi:hypothetical protein
MKRAAWWIPILFLAAPAAAADDDVAAARFKRAHEALEKRDFEGALLDLESLADKGVAHPDVSYNRGLAYALRARTKAAVPGDLGQAAAGFEEALRLRGDDAVASTALDLVRAEVARRRSRQDKTDTVVRPSIDRVFLRLLTPNTWAILAGIASVLVAVGLLLRRRAGTTAGVAGTVVLSLSVFASLVLVPVTFASRWLEESFRPGVIVIPEASLLDDAGKPTNAPELPEASHVELGADRDGKVLVRWGAYDGWLPRAAVRPLAD